LEGECKLREFENRVLRTIFGPKKDDVTRGWTKWHDEGLCNYSALSAIKMKKSGMFSCKGNAS
jgi:hypothetical protein